MSNILSPTKSPVHILHAHTTFSMLDGASPPADYIKYAHKNGLGAVASTDHGWLTGAYDLVEGCRKYSDPKWCKEKGIEPSTIKPIPGCEFYLKPLDNHQFKDKPYDYFHITCWAYNMAGYRNLIALASHSWDPGKSVVKWGKYKPRISFDDLMIYGEGLIVGTGCIEGPLGKCVLNGEWEQARINAMLLKHIFGNRLFFEMMPAVVDRDYVRENVIQVRTMAGAILNFKPEDVLTTDLGAHPASELVRMRPGRIDQCLPVRMQDTPFWDSTVVQPNSWGSAIGQFVGNECCWPYPGGRGHHGCMQHHVNQFVVEEARRLDGQLLLTLDAHMVRPETKMIQDILLQNGNKNGWRASRAYYQMDTNQAYEEWNQFHREIPDHNKVFQEGVENNTRLVEMVEQIVIPKKYHLPEPDLPYEIQSAEATRDQKLQAYTMQRILKHGRLPQEEPRRTEYLERLAKEINVIAYNGKINFLPYFLICDEEICAASRDMEEPVGPGRGSAAGSLLAYLLKITHVDPIVWDLSFERFLSLGRIARGKFPDIDIDLANPKAIADRLQQKYGEKFARICTTGTAQLKGAIRDIARILHPEASEQVNLVCNGIQPMPQGADAKKWLYGYEDSEGVHVGYLDQDQALKSFLEAYPDIFKALNEVLGVPRSVGKHASAYCISDESLIDMVPMCEVGGKNDRETCTQFTMGAVEALGLIKMDLLGLNTLKDISGAVKLIRERHNIEIDIYEMEYEDRLPQAFDSQRDHSETFRIGINVNDPRCYENFCRGRAETVFQFNSAISTKYTQLVQTRTLLDLANVTANCRPGTMYATLEDGETALIDAWVLRRQKKQPITYSHPDLEDILEPTEGIFTYQEQIMAAFVKSCGYSEQESDEIREIIGKKQKEKMDKILPDIRQRLLTRGWDQSQIDSFISLCVAASSYSFNKSHSVAYAYVGYICMWLKTNFNLEWWCSVLENAKPEDLKKAARYIGEITQPPEVNTSLLDFYIIDDGLGKLVFPINRVKNVAGAGEYIWYARHTPPDAEKVKRVKGEPLPTLPADAPEYPFVDFEDFYNRVDRSRVNSKVVSSLIWAGGFDRLCGVTHITERNAVYRKYLEVKKDKKGIEAFVDWTEEDLMKKQMEFLAIGSADFVELLKRKTGLNIKDPGDVARFQPGDTVRVGGVALRIKTIKTKTGKTPGQPMAFVDLGNEANEVNVVVFPRAYQKFQHVLKEGELMIIVGKVDMKDGNKTLIADEIVVIKDDEPEEPEED